MDRASGDASGVHPESVTFIDASTFLGMHAVDEELRRACKAFFVASLTRPLAMSLEEVGRCDDVIWSRPRAVQDAYYPFMDRLHSELVIRRRALRRADVAVAESDARLADLPDASRFTLGMVLRAGVGLVTVNPRLLAARDLPVTAPGLAGEVRFPPHLEELYRRSLVLRLPLEEVAG